MFNVEEGRMMIERKALAWIVTVTLFTLSLPLIGMHLSDDVAWTLGDFGVAAALLASAGLAIAFLLTRLHTLPKRIAGAAGVFLALAVIWVQLAVGLL